MRRSRDRAGFEYRGRNGGDVWRQGRTRRCGAGGTEDQAQAAGGGVRAIGQTNIVVDGGEVDAVAVATGEAGDGGGAILKDRRAEAVVEIIRDCSHIVCGSLFNQPTDEIIKCTVTVILDRLAEAVADVGSGDIPRVLIGRDIVLAVAGQVHLC